MSFRRLRGSAVRAARACLTLAAIGSWLACATVEHGSSISEVASRTLSTRSAEGRHRLEVEADYDHAIRDLMTRRGVPEFIHVVDRDRVYLFYTEADWIALVTRPMVPPGEVQVIERIPGHLIRLLPNSEVQRILERREAHARAKRPARRSHKAPSPAPAERPRTPKTSATDRDTSVSFRDFDPERIVRRLRVSMSAADPGVSDWKSGTLADGRPEHHANLGPMRYEVRSDLLTVSAPIPPRGRSPSKRTLHGFYRINEAVFGANAEKVSRRIEPLVSRVAADTSGRTRIVRRVAGRTVSVARDPQRGVIVYSVHAR